MEQKPTPRYKAILTACIIGIASISATSITTQVVAANSNVTSITPAQLSSVAYSMNANMAQRNLTTSERNLYQQLYNIANSQNSLYNPSIFQLFSSTKMFAAKSVNNLQSYNSWLRIPTASVLNRKFYWQPMHLS
ncbi:hypothetical protein [Acinetobacter bereziniae]|uniref:hypothetical protein n=1 Tax=Acinetobacter bereziniae TaxID=106648 RepID=UPI0021D22747|nr:hypothetical protein [Acinetobacter bereziniae]